MKFSNGIGYDVHPLQKGRCLVLGGIEIPYEKGLIGHSDADVLVHAICDALLGAISEGGNRRAFSGHRSTVSGVVKPQVP